MASKLPPARQVYSKVQRVETHQNDALISINMTEENTRSIVKQRIGLGWVGWIFIPELLLTQQNDLLTHFLIKSPSKIQNSSCYLLSPQIGRAHV